MPSKSIENKSTEICGDHRIPSKNLEFVYSRMSESEDPIRLRSQFPRRPDQIRNSRRKERRMNTQYTPWPGSGCTLLETAQRLAKPISWKAWRWYEDGKPIKPTGGMRLGYFHRV